MIEDAAKAAGADAPQRECSASLSLRVNELYHDLQASSFNEVHRHRHQIEGRFWSRVVAARLLQADASFGVDLCTGTGFVPRVLLSCLPRKVRILCVDLSPVTLSQAKATLEEFEGQVSFHAGDAASLPLAAESADWVSMNAGLHHIPAPSSVLREVHRILKPGGWFCLGHEPNAAFFSSSVLVGIERLIWHLFWYTSPRRNIGRIKRKLGRQGEQYEAHEHLDAINEALLREHLIQRPLTLAELRKLVDVHTHGKGEREEKTGFHAAELLREAFPDYSVELLIHGDFGGEMLRRHRLLRSAFDAVMGVAFPGKGRLFSWVIRKPLARTAAPVLP